MPVKIEDNTGSAHGLEVDSSNRAQTLATTITEEHHVSQAEGNAYMLNSAEADLALTLTAVEGPIMFLQNDNSTLNLIIQKIFVSSATAGVIVIVRKNMTVGSVGNSNSTVPVNLNFESGKLAEATTHVWEETGDGLTNLSAGTIISADYIGAGLTPLPFEGAIQLAKDDNIVISTELTTAEFTCRIRFYYDKI